MAEDAQLEKMRFEIVPKVITEEQFWRNYFYRVSLICQASDLGTLGAQDSENEGMFNVQCSIVFRLTDDFHRCSFLERCRIARNA